MDPTICIAVACKGQAQFLAEAIGSLVSQTFADWQAVIAAGDDESYGEALRLQRDEPRVWVLSELADRGISDARNRALVCNNSPYCMALDADDRLDTVYLARTLPLAGPTTIATTNLQEFGDRQGWWDTHWLTPQFQDRILQDNCIHCASVFPRALFEKVGGYDVELKALEDWALWIAMAKAGATVAHVPERLFYYRQHAGGGSRQRHEATARERIRERFAAAGAA